MAEKEGFHLDPNRKHTEAEAELVMYLFDCGRKEAWGILNAKPSSEMMALAQGMAHHRVPCQGRERRGLPRLGAHHQPFHEFHSRAPL